MAKRKAKKEFKPGDRVIWFSTYGKMSREPVIAWIPEQRWYPSVVGNRVRVNRHEKDAAAGLGVLDSIDYVHPWDDALWSLCEKYFDDKAELEARLKRLQKGRL